MMIDKLSKNEMHVLVILFRHEPLKISGIQKSLKPKVEGSFPALCGVLKNVKNLMALGLIQRGNGKAITLTPNGKYYAELFHKISRGQIV